MHLVSFHSSSILLPLGLQPVISPASILHSPFLSSPSSSGPRGCHRHVLKLTSAVVSLLFTHLPSFPKLPEQNPDPQHGVMIIQDLVPPTFQLIPATLLGLIWLAASSSTLHWVLPALHICSCYRLCQFFLPFSSCLILQLCPFFKVLLNSSMKPPLVPPRGDVTTFL